MSLKGTLLLAAMTLLSLGQTGSAQPQATTPGDRPGESSAAVIVDPLRPTPLLEKRSYIFNMTVLAHHSPGEQRNEKMNMMAVGDRRYLIQNSRILDISDPLHPALMSEGGWIGNHQIQVAYNDFVGKWVAVVTDMGGRPQPGAEKPNRGISVYDISDPRHPKLLSQWANYQGSHRNYYDGGRYAYVTGSTGPDWNTNSGDMWGGSTGGLQVVDLSDPALPKSVATWHYPGQLESEVEARSKWSSANDRARMATLHGPEYVPLRVEDGGKLGYGPWGSLGMMIHDLSDPAHPKLVSRWEPDHYTSGLAGLAFHTIDIARLDRGFVITNPETFWPQCRQPYADSYIVDVSDPAHPRQLAVMPVPKPPPEAPYRSFCDRYGRFGPHNPPHLKAPGKPAPNFTCYSFFAAGLQCYDISDPRNPRINAYFVPEQGGTHTRWEPLSGPMNETIRTVDNVFIEWDRKLIWAATDSGLYLLSSPALGKPILTPMPVREWTLPSVNKGWQHFKLPNE
jgi:hypothetical protein